MDIEEFKRKCLKSITKESQLAEAEKFAKNHSMDSYHSGRMQAWLEVHKVLVRWF